MGTPQISVEGDSATGQFYVLGVHVMRSDETLVMMGINYDQVFRRSEGRWVIVQHRIQCLWSDDGGALLGGVGREAPE